MIELSGRINTIIELSGRVDIYVVIISGTQLDFSIADNSAHLGSV